MTSPSPSLSPLLPLRSELSTWRMWCSGPDEPRGFHGPRKQGKVYFINMPKMADNGSALLKTSHEPRSSALSLFHMFSLGSLGWKGSSVWRGSWCFEICKWNEQEGRPWAGTHRWFDLKLYFYPTFLIFFFLLIPLGQQTDSKRDSVRVGKTWVINYEASVLTRLELCCQSAREFWRRWCLRLAEVIGACQSPTAN